MKNIYFCLSVSFILSLLFTVSGLLANNIYTSKDYFGWRDKLRQENPNDFKAAKFCKSLIGYNVTFESKVMNVNKNAEIMADMDSGIMSLPDIMLTLKDKDQAEDLKNGHLIKYDGVISKCEYNSITSTLFLSVSSGALNLHY